MSVCALLLLSALTFPVSLAQAQPSALERRMGIAFLPLENRSEFSGGWNISVEMSRYLSSYLKSQFAISVISAPVVSTYRDESDPPPAFDDVKFWRSLGKRFGVRYLVTGTIDQFDVSRFKAGAEAIGGYESYKGEVAITFDVIDLQRLESSGDILSVVRGDAMGSYADRSLAWTLLGKPTERTVEFRDLTTMQFGGDEFGRTVIGQACLDVARQFVRTLLERIPGLASLRGRGSGPRDGPDSLLIEFRDRIVEGKIVFVEGSDVIIDIGSDDGVREGAIIPVLRSASNDAAQSGTLKVIQVRGPHMSLARIVAGKDSISASHIIRLHLVE